MLQERGVIHLPYFRLGGVVRTKCATWLVAWDDPVTADFPKIYLSRSAPARLQFQREPSLALRRDGSHARVCVIAFRRDTACTLEGGRLQACKGGIANSSRDGAFTETLR